MGPIPDGYEVDHVKGRGCVSRLCVRIAHLEPVTSDENQRRNRLKVCRSGRHDLTKDENVQWDRQGRRRGCILCHREKALASYYRKKEVV